MASALLLAPFVIISYRPPMDSTRYICCWWMTDSAIPGKIFNHHHAGIYSVLSVIFQVFQINGAMNGKNAPVERADVLRGMAAVREKGRNEILANPT